MSAVEALAEALRGHDWADKEREGQYYTPSIHARHGYDSRCAVCRHDLEGQTSVLVAAIRSMPAEQVAELIDGTVDEGVQAADGGGVMPPPRWDNPLRVDGVPVVRVVGPWLPLGVSPETNGEQK